MCHQQSRCRAGCNTRLLNRPAGAERDPVGAERGSAAVDFVLIGTLLTFLFIALAQLCIVLYVRNVLVSSAAAGARYGAAVPRDETDAAAKTRTLITAAMPGSIAAVVTSQMTTDSSGLQLVEVDVTAPLPLFGLIGPAQTLKVTGHAFKEGQ